MEIAKPDTDTQKFYEWRSKIHDIKFHEHSVKNKTWREFDDLYKAEIDNYEKNIRNIIPIDSSAKTLHWINYELSEILKNYGYWSKRIYESQCFNKIRKALGQRTYKKESGAIVISCEIVNNSIINVCVYKDNYLDHYSDKIETSLIDCGFSIINIFQK